MERTGPRRFDSDPSTTAVLRAARETRRLREGAERGPTGSEERRLLDAVIEAVAHRRG